MNATTKLLFSIITLVMIGCAEPVLIVGQPRAAINSDDVVIYFADRPQCSFETIAHIRVSGGYYSLDRMIAKMRQQAAEVGASGLYVVQTQQLDVKEFLGTAKAIRCLSA